MRSLLLIGALLLAIASVSAPVNAAGVRTFVRHEVTDYAAWRSVFDQSHAMQRKMGVSYTAVYQSTDNPNDITVVSDFKTEAKAKAFAASDELKAAMQSAGVKGVPQVWFTRITPGASGKTGHVRMFVRHQVSDYASWRRHYNEFQDTTGRHMGVMAQAVFRGTDDPNDITVLHDFASDAKAKAFANSAELKSAMQNSGVTGSPQVWFTARAAK